MRSITATWQAEGEELRAIMEEELGRYDEMPHYRVLRAFAEIFVKQAPTGEAAFTTAHLAIAEAVQHWTLYRQNHI